MAGNPIRQQPFSSPCICSPLAGLSHWVPKPECWLSCHSFSFVLQPLPWYSSEQHCMPVARPSSVLAHHCELSQSSATSPLSWGGVVRTVSSHSRPHGIAHLYQCWEVMWPICPLLFIQFSYHMHHSLMKVPGCALVCG